MARIAIFRSVKHPELQKIGVKDGHADAAFLARAAENTNRLIREKRHIPPIKQTHGGSIDGTARGWAQSISTDGSTLFAEVDLTPKGKQQVKDRELRFVSASFRRDFALTGEPDGAKLDGPYLDHVAFLGDENPAIKALVDLSEVEFSEGEPRAWITSNQDSSEITYFAERSLSREENEDMETIAELAEKNTKLAADFADEKRKREVAEAKLAEREKADADAKFAEHKATIGKRIEAAVKAKKLTAEKAILLTQRGEKAYGNPDALALFSELLDTLDPVVPTDPLPSDKGKKGEEIIDVSEADFAEAQNGSAKAIQKLHVAAEKYMQSHPSQEPYPVAYAKALAAVRTAVAQ